MAADSDPRDALLREVVRHPRVVHQGLFADQASLAAIRAALPRFVPFKGATYGATVWVLDWDHRLPSRELVLRAYAFYDQSGLARAEKALAQARERIASEDLFPEFDVSDFAGMPADEAYEGELHLNGEVKKLRMVSDWRREIDARMGRRAEDIVRKSAPFKELSSQVRARPPGLGDLEASEWSSPAESGYHRWGLDVWYLRNFNGMVGEGTAFLVDLQDETVVSQRDFQFRAG